MSGISSFFIDFNSFFSSVEQQFNPSLRGHPVGVVPVLTESSCCIAASYEAKKFGIKTGTGVREAKKLCPEIVFVHAQHEKYVQVHHEAVAAVDRILPVRQVLSIDEMECELPRRWQSAQAAIAIAAKVKREILETVGDQLHTSIGIAPNTLLAKLASDMQKPNGLVILHPEDIPAKFLHLRLQDITGIGRRMLTRLSLCEIDSIQKLYEAPRDLLRTAWGGVLGDEMFDKLHGVPYPPRQTHARSLGHSHILPPAMRNPHDAFAVLNRLTQKAAMRLRKQGFYASAMSVSLHNEHAYKPSKNSSRDARFAQTQDTAYLLNVLASLWQQGLHQFKKPKGVGVVLYGLVLENQHTPDLFGMDLSGTTLQPGQERHSLLRTVDSINRQYGKNAVYFATAHEALDHAPMRIAFNRIPDLETET